MEVLSWMKQVVWPTTERRKTAVCYQTEKFEGVVTSLHNNNGTVNFDIYFTRREGWPVLEIGSSVLGTKERWQPNEAWRAVELFLQFEDNEVTGKSWEIVRLPRFVIDRIEHLSDTVLETAKGFRFDIIDKDLDVKFREGDWVEIERNGDPDLAICKKNILPINSLKPNRIKTVYGEVTQRNRTHIIINDDIYCSLTLVDPSWTRGHRVITRVIECDLLDFSWRSIECHSDVYRNESQIKYQADGSTPDEKLEQNITESKLKGILNVSQLSFNKTQDISISVPPACLSWPCPNSQETMLFELTNKSSSTVEISDIWIVSPKDCIEFKKSPSAPKSIGGRSHVILPLRCSSKQHGSIDFKIVIKSPIGLFAKDIKVQVDPTPCTVVLPKVFSHENHEDFIPGVKKRMKKSQNFGPNLPVYKIPEDLRKSLSNGTVIEDYPILKENLTPKNYAAKLSTLLYLEEMAVVHAMNMFNPGRVVFTREGDFLVVEICGLVEKRPSIAVGDKIYAKPADRGVNSGNYEGYVHQIREEKVYLMFNEKFHENYQGYECSLRFYPNRTQFRRQHMSVESCMKNLSKEVLFPTQILSYKRNKKLVTPDSLKFLNTKLNKEQKAAVCCVVDGVASPAPYIIYGPPGTGKTVTLVECVLQIFQNVKHSRILLVTLSNSACDLLMSRILEWGITKEEDMVRILAYSRDKLSLPEELHRFCIHGDEMGAAIRRRLIVCTAAVSGQFHLLRNPKGLFSHLFFDEAGQLSEPDSCVPLSFVDPAKCQIVLAGDPKQLGPMVCGSLPAKYGLNTSLLQRLASSVLYQPSVNGCEGSGDSDVTYDERLVTQLRQSYRSHPDIIEIPSKLFYHSTLVSAVRTEEANALLKWPELPNPLCPILFHGVCGKTESNGSTSWSNLEEIEVALRHMWELFAFGIDPSDVGIVTPYRKQVEKFRRLLDAYGVKGVKVASVQEFQGQERKVIILSTVRSSKNELEIDIQFGLGFVKSPERFNVAVTRAKFLLIIIGDPTLLQEDPNWSQLLNYCISKSAYKGVRLTTIPQ